MSTGASSGSTQMSVISRRSNWAPQQPRLESRTRRLAQWRTHCEQAGGARPVGGGKVEQPRLGGVSGTHAELAEVHAAASVIPPRPVGHREGGLSGPLLPDSGAVGECSCGGKPSTGGVTDSRHEADPTSGLVRLKSEMGEHVALARNLDSAIKRQKTVLLRAETLMQRLRDLNYQEPLGHKLEQLRPVQLRHRKRSATIPRTVRSAVGSALLSQRGARQP